MNFQTDEVKQLYEKVSVWCHPKYPFLDAHYSPGSGIPAMDFTLIIADWISTSKIEAIKELWLYLVGDGDTQRLLLRNALKAKFPSWLHISQNAITELQAISLLMLRAAFGRTMNIGQVGISLAATTIGCRTIEIDRSIKERFLAACGLEYNPRPALELAESPLGLCDLASEKLKSVSPMARRVVHAYFGSGYKSGVLNYGLFYDDRVYGCGVESNQAYVDWLGFFETPIENIDIPKTITKEHLRAVLNANGIDCLQSVTRKVMVEMVKNSSGLATQLIGQYCPEYKVVKAEWNESLQAWVSRVEGIKPIAAALICLLQESTIKNGAQISI